MKIVVCGSHGRMGSLVVLCAKELDLEIVGTINRGTDMAQEFEKQPDVCVDFSVPECLVDLCRCAADLGVKIVSGTTGLTIEQSEKISNFAKKIPILHASNFSIGVFVLNKLVRSAAEALPETFDIEIIERHHNQKKDAPSGSAMSLLSTIKSVHRCDALFGRHGESKRGKDEICIHAVRGGDIVGEHEVMFAGKGECIEIIHRATNREIFARGALHVSKVFAGINKPGLYSLADVL